MKKKSMKIDGKTVALYPSEKADAPIVYSCDFSNAAGMVLRACEELDCPEFHLVSITGIHWDEELSPWPHGPIVAKDDHFTGEADTFLDTLEKEIMPKVQELFPDSSVSLLHGYSMGGLFALYAAHNGTAFDAYLAPSASVWYPDFIDYVKGRGFERKPKAIYLSIGDKESKTRNAYLSQTESNMRALQGIYEEKAVTSTFELNDGNHYKNVPTRIAKALKWTLEQLEEEKGA